MNKFSSTDWNTVLRMLAGGSMLGGGVGAAVTFANHLKELQDRAKPVSSDADTLYLDLPAKPQPTKAASTADNGNANTASTFALSGLAGLAGTALAYNAVRSIYNRQRKKQLENDLAQAHHIYIQGNTEKAASAYSMPTKVVGSGYLAVLLTALGSAVVANSMLKKRYPAMQSPIEGQPRKIVVRSVDPTTHQPVGNMEGAADVSPDAVEGLARTQLARTKMAAQNDLVTVVSALACGRGAEMKELIKSAGVDGMMEAIKGASCDHINPVERNLAVSLLAHDTLLREALSPMIAAEFFKEATWTFDVLPSLNPQQCEHLTALVKSAAIAAREQALAPVLSKWDAAYEAGNAGIVKRAEEVSISPMKTLFVAGALNSILDKHHDDPNTEEQARRDTAEGQDSPKTTGVGVDLEVDDESAQKFVDKHLREIDKLRQPA